MPVVEVVVADDDGESRPVGTGRRAHSFQLPSETAVIARDGEARFVQALLGPPGRRAERRPEGRPAPLHRMLARDDVSPRREGDKRVAQVGCGVRKRKGRHDLILRALPVEEGEKIAIDLSVQQGVKGVRHKQNLPIADRAMLEMRRERRQRNQAAVGGGGLRQYPALRGGPQWRLHVHVSRRTRRFETASLRPIDMQTDKRSFRMMTADVTCISNALRGLN